MRLPPNWDLSGGRGSGDDWHIIYLFQEQCNPIHIHTNNFRHQDGKGVEAQLTRAPEVGVPGGVWVRDGGEADVYEDELYIG